MRIAIPGGVTRLALLFGLLSVGCGPDFDPPSELHTLRVLAVQKDAPYAKPDQEVNLSMLWEDASELRGRPVQIAWSPVCVNPKGDLYYSCFTDPALFDCPFVMGTEVGRAVITPQDAAALRLYLDKGGFLWVDDFWGTYAWDHWVAQLRRVLPANEFPIFDLPLDNPLFRT